MSSNEQGGAGEPPSEILALCALEPLNDTGNAKRLLLHFGPDGAHNVRDVGWNN